MKVTMPYVVAVIKRGEGSKTPKVVMEHEVDVLKVMFGDDGVEITKDKPPVDKCTFETEDEYVRLQGAYFGNNEKPNPTLIAFPRLKDFEDAFEMPDDGEKEALIQQAKGLGIKGVSKNWGIPKLQQAIEEAQQ